MSRRTSPRFAAAARRSKLREATRDERPRKLKRRTNDELADKPTMAHPYALARAALLAVLTFACSSNAARARTVAGRYELRSVNGKAVPVDALGGALGGELVLSASGRGRRVVSYARSGVPEPFVHRSAGTYSVSGSEITLSFFTEGPRQPASRWTARGELHGRSILIRHSGRAGEMVEEEYVKVSGK